MSRPVRALVGVLAGLVMVLAGVWIVFGLLAFGMSLIVTGVVSIVWYGLVLNVDDEVSLREEVTR